jgi:hypothetical protein
MSHPVNIGKYHLRRAGAQDLDLLAVWIAADPDHRNTVQPEFFATQGDGLECFAVEDESDTVVFYIKMTRALRLDIQFGPEETLAQREQNADALRSGFEWLHAGASGAGIHQILFNSTNPPLVNFATRRLGFDRSPEELLRVVTPLAGYKPQENTLRP